MSCLPCWWRKPTGTMTRLLLHEVAWTIFHHRSSYECGECKKALCIYPCFKQFHTLTVYKAKWTEAFHSLPQVPVGYESKKHVQKKNAAEGTRHLIRGVLPLLRSSIYPPVAVHVSHNGCRRSKTKPSPANKLYICQQTDHLSLSTTSSVAVNKHHLSLSKNCSTAAGP